MSFEFLSDYQKSTRTWNVKTELPVEFSLKYSPNVLSSSNKDILFSATSGRCIFVVDHNILQIYGEHLHSYAESNNLNLQIHSVRCIEGEKNWDNVDGILSFFEENSVLRREPVFCLGGGILLDIAGFACSLYRRGIPYIKIPTTLLAIVDASVGSKVGINHFDRRNRLGAYYPPLSTFIDRSFIKSESTRHIINGLGEIFKLSLIKSRELFELLESEAQLLLSEKFQYGAVPVRVINLSISEMISELSTNLWEKELKRCVDFGHTFSPIPEMKYSHELMHGEAVALDCLFTACLSYNRQLLSYDELARVFQLAKSLKLPTSHSSFSSPDLLFKSLEDATIHRNGSQNIPLTAGIGNYKFVSNISYSEVSAAVSILADLNQ